MHVNPVMSRCMEGNTVAHMHCRTGSDGWNRMAERTQRPRKRNKFRMTFPSTCDLYKCLSAWQASWPPVARLVVLDKGFYLHHHGVIVWMN
uniref:Uncharacterized protein n=1 Tax=Romanomermis culicivorax TaxID=13658 RepID=A0A915K9X0_ROMCU